MVHLNSLKAFVYVVLCLQIVACTNSPRVVSGRLEPAVEAKPSESATPTWDATGRITEIAMQPWTVSCNANWNETCSGDPVIDVPTEMVKKINLCPNVTLTRCDNVEPGGDIVQYKPADLCSFTYTEVHADGGKGWPTGADVRHIYFHVESEGSHNIIDRWGGDASYEIRIKLIDSQASDAQRIENGCTRPAGKCTCKDLNSSITMGTHDTCSEMDCRQACSKLSDNQKTIGMLKFEPGIGSDVCPIR